MVADVAALMLQMLRIRRFEERALDEFGKGRLFGTTHTCIGQEADAVGVIGALDSGDIVFSNHRGHGHFLAYGGSMRALAAELLGRASGVSGALGGSQHLHYRNFYSNGVQGGIVPNAAGMAMAEKYKRSGAIVAVFLGDGTFGEGVIYETFNLAALWQLPLLLVVENNQYAQSTPLELNFRGNFLARLKGFEIAAAELHTTDVRAIRTASVELTRQVREQSAPHALVLHTYRLAAHSKGDDTRDPAEIEAHRRSDPLVILRPAVAAAVYQELDLQATREVDSAFAAASEEDLPDPALLRDSDLALLDE